MKTKVLVVADDSGFEHWLESADGANLDAVLIRGVEPSQLLQAVAAHSRYDMVFCEFTPANAMLRASFVEQFHERHWQIPVVGLGNGENAECLLAAMRAGARDFLVRGRDDANLGNQIGRLLKRSAASTAAAATPGRTGQIFLTVPGTRTSRSPFSPSIWRWRSPRSRRRPTRCCSSISPHRRARRRSS